MTRASWIVGLAMFVAMVGSNLPAPLYELYRARFGFSTFVLTAIFATYPLALVVALIASARVPDRLGRRATLALGVAVSGVGAAFFAAATDVAWLLAGRIAAAAAIGLIAAAGAPALVELRRDGDRRRAALVATFALSLACGVAPAVSGALASIAGVPLAAAYLVDIAACIAVVVALFRWVPETRPDGSANVVARVHLDARSRRALLVATLGAGVGWWLASLFVSVVPSYVGRLLGVHSPALQGLFALAVFVASPIVQTAARNADPRQTLRAAMGCAVIAIAGIVAAVPLQSVMLFALATILAGVAQGASFLATQGIVNQLGTSLERARLSARFYAGIYLLIGAPVLALGAIATRYGLFAGFAIVGAAGACAALGVIVALPRPDATAGP